MKLTPANYEQEFDRLMKEHSIPEQVPEGVRILQIESLGLTALGYEQFLLARFSLMRPLEHAAIQAATVALEVALRSYLKAGKSTSLRDLIERVQERNHPAFLSIPQAVWDTLRDNRNDISHGNPEALQFGPAHGEVVEFLVDTASSLYRETI